MVAKRRESTAGANQAAFTEKSGAAGPDRWIRGAGLRRLTAVFAAVLAGLTMVTYQAEAGPRGLIGARAAALDAPAPVAVSDVIVERAIATDPHLDDAADHATLTFALTGPVKVKAFAMAEPDRIVVDLPEIDFRAADTEQGQAARGGRRGLQVNRAPVRQTGLIGSFRCGFFTAGKSRIVIDLASPARIVRAESEKSPDGKIQLVIELAKADPAQFHRAAQGAADMTVRAQARASDTPPVPPPPQKAAALPVVVVDAGHGGIDRGATGNGLIEKDLVFDFAKALQAKLEASGRFKVVMTRDSDIFVPLADRVRIARDAGAQLFVSIHADTLVEAAGVSGATFYTVSERASDSEAARTAEKENQADAAAGVDRREEASGVNDILFDLTRRETRAYSHVFARTLLNYWKVAGRLNKNPERAAGFRVLMAPDVPSVLIELGYLSSEKDAASFASADWRDKTSEKITQAIAAFFAARGSETRTDLAPTPPDTAEQRRHLSAAPPDLELRGDRTANVAGTSQ